MLRMIAILFGIAFIFGGIAGFLPSFTTDGLLLGYFSVNLLHNLFHIATGVIAIMCAVSHQATKYFFILFGILYGVIAIAGFSGAEIMSGMQLNMADNVLHVFVAAVALFLGFSARSRQS